MKTLRKACIKGYLSQAQVVLETLAENYMFSASNEEVELVREFCEKTYPEFGKMPETSVYEVDYIDVRPQYRVTVLMSEYGYFSVKFGQDVEGALEWTTKNEDDPNSPKSAILADGFTIGSLSTEIFRVGSKQKAVQTVYDLVPAGGTLNRISYMTGKAVKRMLTDEKVSSFIRQILPNFDSLPETEEESQPEVWMGGDSRFGGHFE